MPFLPSLPRKSHLAALLLVFFAIWFCNLEYRHLVPPDEGRYAEIPREMVASGDWVTPRLDGIKYFEKPALQYWATATAYVLFGEHHWTARLWPALTGFLGVLVVGFTGARLFGPRAGLYAAAVLASSFLYTMIAHVITLDTGVTFFMTLALCAFLLAQHEDTTPDGSRRWMRLTWLALACSVLSKGLIGVVLPGAVLVLHTLLQRDWRLWTRLRLLEGVVLFSLVTVPWFVLVTLRNPEFFHFFFIREHFERFLTKVHERYQPWWFFIPILVLGMLPWVLPFLDALARAWRADTGSTGLKPRRFLFLWAVFIFLFFSISDSKLPGYILPIFPALALLVGDRLTRLSPRAFAWQTAPLAALALAAIWLAPKVVVKADEEVTLDLYLRYVPWLTAAAAVMLAGSLAAVFFARRRQSTRAVLTLAFAGLVSSQLALSGHESLAPAKSAWFVAQEIRPYLKPGIPFYSVGMYDQTLPFYIKRTVTVVGWRDELDFGFTQEPDKWVPDDEAFARLWQSQKEALAIMHPGRYAALSQRHLPMRVIVQDARRVVVEKP